MDQLLMRQRRNMDHSLKKPNKKSKAIKRLVGLDTRHAHGGDSPANFELQCISICFEEIVQYLKT